MPRKVYKTGYIDNHGEHFNIPQGTIIYPDHSIKIPGQLRVSYDPYGKFNYSGLISSTGAEQNTKPTPAPKHTHASVTFSPPVPVHVYAPTPAPTNVYRPATVQVLTHASAKHPVLTHAITGEENQEQYARTHHTNTVTPSVLNVKPNINTMNFKTAFNQARNSGKGIFRWNGKLYNTMSKQDASNADSQLDFRNQHQDYNNFIQGNMIQRSKAGWGNGFAPVATTYNPGSLQQPVPVPLQINGPATNTYDRKDVRDLFGNIHASDINSLVSGIIGMQDNNLIKNQIYQKAGITSSMDPQEQANMLYNTFSRDNIHGNLGGNDRRRFREWLNPTQKFQLGGQMSQQQPQSQSQPQAQQPQGDQGQGGDVMQQAQQIMQQVSLMSDQDRQLFDQAFAQFCKQNNIDINQLQGDKQAFAQALVAFAQAQQQQQVQSARMGAKLQYMNQLKGECPQGQHLEYFKAGGKVCKKCMANSPAPQKFQKGKKKIPISVKQVESPVPMKKCGGKAKAKVGKMANGGTLTEQFRNFYIK